jgi:hypothetical protein
MFPALAAYDSMHLLSIRALRETGLMAWSQPQNPRNLWKQNLRMVTTGPGGPNAAQFGGIESVSSEMSEAEAPSKRRVSKPTLIRLKRSRAERARRIVRIVRTVTTPQRCDPSQQ